MLPSSFAQLELPSHRGSKRKNLHSPPRSSNKSASLSLVSIVRERDFIGVFNACAITSAILKLDLSSGPSWERNERGKNGEKKISFTVSSTRDYFAQSSGWEEGISSGVFVASACRTVPGFSSHSGRI